MLWNWFQSITKIISTLSNMLKSWFHVSNSLQNGHISPDAFFSTTKGVANIIYTADSSPTSKVSSLSDWIYQNDFKIQYPSAYRCLICVNSLIQGKNHSKLRFPIFLEIFQPSLAVRKSISKIQKPLPFLRDVGSSRIYLASKHGTFMDLPNPSNFPLSSQCLSNLGNIMNHDPLDIP